MTIYYSIPYAKVLASLRVCEWGTSSARVGYTLVRQRPFQLRTLPQRRTLISEALRIPPKILFGPFVALLLHIYRYEHEVI
jgi:hypothetical protein